MDSDSEYLSDSFPIQPSTDEYRLRSALKPPRTTTYTAQALYDQIHEGVIDLDPEYQRDVVWSENKQVNLIDSVLRNFYVPPIIFTVSIADDGTERRTCIDGKQRLTSIQKFMDGLIFHRDPYVINIYTKINLIDVIFSDTANKYWYKKLNPRTRGTILPERYRRLFANKQVVCIEYHDLTEDNEREIFRRVQLGMALTPAEKNARGGANTSTGACSGCGHPIYGAIRGVEVLNQTRSIISMGSSHNRHDCWIPGQKTAMTAKQITKWLADPSVPDSNLVQKVYQSFEVAIGLVEGDRSFLKVTQGPNTVAPADLVMMILLTSLLKDQLPRDKIALCIQAMREEVRKVHVDIMWNSKVLATYLAFINRLQSSYEQKSMSDITKNSTFTQHPPLVSIAIPIQPSIQSVQSPIASSQNRLASLRAAKATNIQVPLAIPPPSAAHTNNPSLTPLVQASSISSASVASTLASVTANPLEANLMAIAQITAASNRFAAPVPPGFMPSTTQVTPTTSEPAPFGVPASTRPNANVGGISSSVSARSAETSAAGRRPEAPGSRPLAVRREDHQHRFHPY
ncbi:hypothetical protein EW146_g5020 [Bondarzewia mesenterica]|uniref:GmrSD restriction endonucleases N-terminal domain-containing protein n=1 Tax=Bondarzewia mesenterica TaxID=1095465 RepID=A0A4S4LSS7_9AGAM|nr:hypothetical protein EW146_g5020 [Bondarzewia mesenterica]